MKFNTTRIDLGQLNEKRSYSAAFSYVEEPDAKPLDLRLSTSCGCTDVYWDKENKAIKFTITTDTVPKHLEHQGYYILNKSIIVASSLFGANEEHLLIITGVVHK